ncbi:MAG TPA: hypothetical protein VLN73_00095, partial [Alphaproteobacteria bacterium]|nr:hypothetical protein [Alphaproteobacteria bacterium]
MKLLSLGLGVAIAAAASGPALADQNFNRIASFEVTRNLPAGASAKTETAAEIIAATADGMTLVYTDSPLR